MATTRALRHHATRLLAAAALAAVAPVVAGAQVVRPVPSEEVPALRAFLQGYLRGSSADGADAPRFAAATVELCRGKGAWVVVHLVAQYACGTGGCTTLVLAPEKGRYREVGGITLSHPPIEVLSARTKGCHALAVHSRYGDAVLPFDGHAFADNPTVPPARPLRPDDARVVAISEGDGMRPVFDQVEPETDRPPGR